MQHIEMINYDSKKEEHMLPFCLSAKTISDAWFQLIYNLFDKTYSQKIQKGSFENEQYRLQYPGIAVFIEHPYYDMVPAIPPGLGIPSPTTMEYIEDYFAHYLMNPELAENETYTYASRIQHSMPKGGTQLERVVDMLRETPLTNQAVIEIATPEDLDVCYGKDGKIDPPCLRILDFKVIPSGDDLVPYRKRLFPVMGPLGGISHQSRRDRTSKTIRRRRNSTEKRPHVCLQRRRPYLRLPGRDRADQDAEDD